MTKLTDDTAVDVYYGVGDGTFEAPIVIPVLPKMRDIAVADLDGDGAPDIAALAVAGTMILYARGRTFVADGVYRSGRGVTEIVAGDVDGDGRQDIVSSAFNALAVLLNQCP